LLGKAANQDNQRNISDEIWLVKKLSNNNAAKRSSNNGLKPILKIFCSDGIRKSMDCYNSSTEKLRDFMGK